MVKSIFVTSNQYKLIRKATLVLPGENFRQNIGEIKKSCFFDLLVTFCNI